MAVLPLEVLEKELYRLLTPENFKPLVPHWKNYLKS
ncbi:hypothetical protein PL921440020 [Planktothrix tepida PCC 9214]|uniref:Uncharacterized protein n=2 Tax=Microcoleaceae TaxID=1892252 RepID=A0A1J1LIZ2_9CYAN|nr:hypothetical protein PL921440020 [Planktothrix tepida PCC 9214]